MIELYDCVKNALRKANDELGCSSIALPPISSGLFGFPVGLCAETMIEAIEAELGQNLPRLLSLTDVRIVVIDQ